MTLRIAFAAVVLAAAGCTTMSTAPTTTQASGEQTYYCWESKMLESDGHIACNWTPDPQLACQSVYEWSSLDRSALASGPTRLRRCPNGQGLMAVTTRQRSAHS